MAISHDQQTDHHRPLKLQEITPDQNDRTNHKNIARLKHDIVRERMQNHAVPTDLTTIPGTNTIKKPILHPINKPNHVKHHKRRLVARALRHHRRGSRARRRRARARLDRDRRRGR